MLPSLLRRSRAKNIFQKMHTIGTGHDYRVFCIGPMSNSHAFTGQVFYSVGKTNMSTTELDKTVKTSIMKKIKDGAVHYWQGTKLLVLETRISCSILWKLLHGEKLIRREYLQLLRTTSDLFRLVPFIIIAIIPFLEFALPVLLKFFPNMLPSTFEDKFQAEEKVKKQLKVKLETAKFLQEMAEILSKDDSNTNDLKNLFHKARTAGKTLTAEEVFNLSKHLHDSIRLENLGRTELLSLCRYMGLGSLGTDNYLRYQIRKSIARLKADDKLIHQEGIESLTMVELKSACHARGIRAVDVSETYMRRELQQWLDLQLKHSVPAPLLILSRALALSERVPIEDALKDAVESLPEPVLASAALKVAEAANPAEKLRIIKEQQALIASELASGDSSVRETTTSEASIDSISEAVATLVSPTPTKSEREDLDGLRQDLHELGRSSHASPKAQAIECQVGKLLTDIEKQIADFECEIGKRLQVISPAEDGAISVTQLQLIMQFIRNSPKDANKLSKIIQAFDKDGDGKIFIRDILEIAAKAKSKNDPSK